MAIARPPAELQTDELRIQFSEFASRLDTRPRARTLPWANFVEQLARHTERPSKDGPGWSPTVYRDGARRGKKGVEYITAIALDFDHCKPPRGQLDGLAWVGHTTFSHRADDPRWRVVIALVRPVPAEDWPEIWLRAQRHFGATADEACKDASRFFYLPSCAPGAERAAERHSGAALDVDDLPPAPEPPRPLRSPRAHGQSTTAGRSHYAVAALEAELTTLASAAAGQRNVQLNRSVYSIAQLVAAGYLDQGEVERAFETVALQIGLEERETARTIRSAMDSGLREPRDVPPSPMPLRVPPPATNGRTHRHDLESTDETLPPDPPTAEDRADTDHPDYHLTDLGNAQRLVAAHGTDLRYAHQLNRWFVWDSMRWADDATAEIERRAKATVRAMYAQAGELDDDARKSLVKHALKSESHKSIGAMVALAKSESGVPVVVEQLDRNPWLLNVHNGTLDLRTGNLRSHRREDLLTKLAPVAYDPAATCPIWLAFLERIMDGNQDLIRFLQRAIGYTLTGSARERVLFMLHGSGANGKSTLLETVAMLLGDYGKSTRAETLLVKHYDGGIPNDLAALKGARFVSTSETEEGKRMAEALVKALTGGDTLSARFLRGEFFTFRATFKLWLATNHRPVIRGSDAAIWDRIKLVPFEVRIPDAEQDKELPAKLQNELPGILAWAVRGCLEWQSARGLGIPTEVQVATANYRADMDTVAAFIEDCCVVGAGRTVEAGKLYDAYKDWCTASGEKFMSKKALGQRLLERPQFEPTRVGKSGTRGWKGLGLASEPQQTAFEADALTNAGGSADAFSEMADASDANPGISPLSAPHQSLSRTTRQNASADQMRQPVDGDDQDLVEVEL